MTAEYVSQMIVAQSLGQWPLGCSAPRVAIEAPENSRVSNARNQNLRFACKVLHLSSQPELTKSSVVRLLPERAAPDLNVNFPQFTEALFCKTRSCHSADSDPRTGPHNSQVEPAQLRLLRSRGKPGCKRSSLGCEPAQWAQVPQRLTVETRRVNMHDSLQAMSNPWEPAPRLPALSVPKIAKAARPPSRRRRRPSRLTLSRLVFNQSCTDSATKAEVFQDSR